MAATAAVAEIADGCVASDYTGRTARTHARHRCHGLTPRTAMAALKVNADAHPTGCPRAREKLPPAAKIDLAAPLMTP